MILNIGYGDLRKKMKTCKLDDCTNSVWGGEYCSRHQHHRKDKEVHSFSRINKPMNKVTDKTRKQKEAIRKADKDFFVSVWNKRQHRCEICLKPLGYTPRSHFFHHILEKGESRYAHLRYEEENIIIVCMDHHAAFHSANKGERMSSIVTSTIEHFKLKNLL